MAIDQEKLKARRQRQNEARKQRRVNNAINALSKSVSEMPMPLAAFVSAGPFQFHTPPRMGGKSRALALYQQMAARGDRDSFAQPKVIQHNAELHKTSAYLAEEARSVERALDRKRWSHAL